MVARDAAALVAINVVWGSSYVVARATLAAVPPLTLACTRCALAWAALVLLTAGIKRHKPNDPSDPVPIPSRVVALVGLLGFCLPYVFFYHGLRLTTASEAAFLVNMEAIFTVILGALILRERVGSRAAWGIALALIGAALLLRTDGREVGTVERPLDRVWGNALVLGALLCEALATVLSRPLRREWPPLLLTRRLVGWGAAGLLLPAIVELVWASRWPGATGTLSLAAFGGIFYLAMGCTVLCYTVWYALLGRVEAGRAAAFLYIQPVVGVALGVALQGDRPDAAAVAGATMILAGVSVTSKL